MMIPRHVAWLFTLVRPLHFSGGGSAPPPPDYTPLANASEKAAQIGADIQQKMIEEGKRQYDQNMTVLKPVIDQQISIANDNQQNAQADRAYMLSKTKPLESSINDMANVSLVDAGAAQRQAILDRGLSAADKMRADADMLKSRTNSFDQAQGADIGAYKAQVATDTKNLTDRVGNYEKDVGADIKDYTGGNSAIMSRYGDDINTDVGNAVADARAGQAQAQNSAMRQAMRYGISVPDNVAGVALAGASQIAGAANTTRNASIDKYRGLIGQGIGMKTGVFQTGQGAMQSALAQGEAGAASAIGMNQGRYTTAMAGMSDAMSRGDAGNAAGINALTTNRNQTVQDFSSDYGRKLDADNMYKGYGSSSQGAYGLAVSAGNSAAGNQMNSGNTLLNWTNAGNNAALTGSGQQISGLGNVLNAQTSYANANQSDGIGSILGGAGRLASGASMLFSDRRLKEGIELVGRDEKTGLNLYRYSYVGQPRQRFEGVMADEVQRVRPSAVHYTHMGVARVDYDQLGITMKEVRHGA